MGEKIKRWFRKTFLKALKKPVVKKHYTKPVLTIIDLDPASAILTQCRISENPGFFLAPHYCTSRPGGGAFTDCDTPVRGRRIPRGSLHNEDSVPS